jgi:HlyD family secretion protein
VSRRGWLIVAVVVLLIGGGIGARVYRNRSNFPAVTVETIRKRDLDAIVSASGTIEPKRQVNVSATTMGRVTRLAVQEGQRVKAGQFLLEIDPRSLAGQIDRGEASVAAARAALEQTTTAVEQARASLDLAQQTLKRQQDLSKDGLTTRESLERAQNDVTLREADLRARQQEVQARQQQIKQEEASLSTTRYNLSQVTIASPMDGIVTRRNIEEGENVVVGTMNNAGTVLLTVADMSAIQAEIQVDETDIPNVAIGQKAVVTIDAVPDKTFKGHVTDIGNSPTQTTTTAANTGQRQATNFKVVVTIDDPVPDVRPGFSCSAEITTATRKDAVAVPIQSLTVRQLLFDDKDALVHEAPPKVQHSLFGTPVVTATPPPPPDPPPGQTRKDTEGVFVVRGDRVVFEPVGIGIAGERYFEVTKGLKPGDDVVTGPFDSVRQIADGSQIKVNPPR